MIPMKRAVVCWGLYWGAPISGNYYAPGRFSTSKIGLHRRFASDNFLLMPLVENPVEGAWADLEF